MTSSTPIRAFIFDLDGTLLETERLKALAYADIIGDLLGKEAPEQAAVTLYQAKVGSTDRTICHHMIEKFDLVPRLRIESGEEPWEALHRQRMERYRSGYGTPGKLRSVQYAHNVALALKAKADGMRVAIATMSFSDEAERVIGALKLDDVVDTVVGVDHVKNEKPAPDVFLLAMEQLGVDAGESLIVEDSPAGTRAAIASGARWLCVPTLFSLAAVREATDIDQRWIVDDPEMLGEMVAQRIESPAG